MTSVEYELLRKKRPDLRLPPYSRLYRSDQRKVKRYSPDQLVGRRTAVLLRRESGKDRKRGPVVRATGIGYKRWPMPHSVIANSDVAF